MTRKLGRKSAHRNQTIRNLTLSVILYEKVDTTKAKAKEAVKQVDKIINISKNNDLNSSKKILGYLFNDKNALKKLREDLSKRFENTNSGYVKMFNIKPRVGDNSKMVRLILSKSKFLNNLNRTKTNANIKPKKK